ncbi:hypothetical protein [uncultured Enterovirga sp.]|uniref:hypothetical protein n=1 Tax=uncultured Enterovirga sp. TaxID=2026352 RepID=UPI0035CB08DB
MAPIKKGRQPAITDLEQARERLARVEATPSNPITKLAMRLMALTVVRPVRLRRRLGANSTGCTRMSRHGLHRPPG